MNPKSSRRVHGAEFKARVLAECKRPGESVAAVALSHGLNVNLVRKWLVGQGLKRTGFAQADASTGSVVSEAVTIAASGLQFVPVELAAPKPLARPAAAKPGLSGPPTPERDIRIELRRGSAQLTVRWPATEAGACAAWLSDLVGTALK